jgi:ketosteroid isomerase-like protein
MPLAFGPGNRKVWSRGLGPCRTGPSTLRGFFALGSLFLAAAVASAMVTIGSARLDRAAHEFYDAMRSYDAKRAAASMTDNATFVSPWSGRVAGRGDVEKFLQTWLGDAKARPSFAIADISGDGALTHLKLSVSGRFGQAPQRMGLDILCLQHKVHHVQFTPAASASH